MSVQAVGLQYIREYYTQNDRLIAVMLRSDRSKCRLTAYRLTRLGRLPLMPFQYRIYFEKPRWKKSPSTSSLGSLFVRSPGSPAPAPRLAARDATAQTQGDSPRAVAALVLRRAGVWSPGTVQGQRVKSVVHMLWLGPAVEYYK